MKLNGLQITGSCNVSRILKADKGALSSLLPLFKFESSGRGLSQALHFSDESLYVELLVHRDREEGITAG